MRNQALNADFRCVHCRQIVPANRSLAGVRNRNHCPYCLWSRHLDLLQAGDRMAACKAEMRPLGLTLKKAAKKYTSGCSGELMLIHQCVECGKISINRIAADDIAEMIYLVYESSRKMAPFIRRQLKAGGILTLRAADHDLVNANLFGRN